MSLSNLLEYKVDVPVLLQNISIAKTLILNESNALTNKDY